MGFSRANMLHATTAPSPGYPDFQSLLGHAAWHRLPALVRRRFATTSPAHTITYRGCMSVVRHSRFGWLCAQLCRVIGTPIAPYAGRDVDMTVRVYDAPKLKGSVWERCYHFPRRPPVLVLSTKCLDGAGRLVEALDFGLHMALEVFEDGGDLVFRSTRYYLEFLGLRLNLPRWIPPGQTTVIHRNLSDGAFRFIFFTRHPLFGEMFYQEGVFHDPLESSV